MKKSIIKSLGIILVLLTISNIFVTVVEYIEFRNLLEQYQFFGIKAIELEMLKSKDVFTLGLFLSLGMVFLTVVFIATVMKSDNPY
tara:strand:+ start:387 stop:644 length:258 start_codon:yes stop_codon:yes gene_type:complete